MKNILKFVWFFWEGDGGSFSSVAWLYIQMSIWQTWL